VITGTVLGLQARIDVLVRLPGQPDLGIECVVDTGFEVALTLPAPAVATLNLRHIGHLDAHLADNSRARVPVHEATIVWDGREIQAAVLAMGNRPLVGTALLDGFNLSADFADNGPLVLRKLGASGP
jgi:clan AA aspartic protease